MSNEIAHDLRTPLTRLRQRLELAQREANSVGEWRETATGCIDEMDAILDTFGGLLRIAQIESGATSHPFGEVDLSALLRTLSEVYEPMADQRHQQFTAHIAGDLRVWGDRDLLGQMLANLIENAMKHSPEGASISLNAAERGAGIEVVVADNGPGIPASERERVFGRFYRLESSRSTPGNGLGLSLAQAVATQHQAKIHLADNNPGLRVSVCLSGMRAPVGEPAGHLAL